MITPPKGNPLTGMAKQLDDNVKAALIKAGNILIKESKRRVPVKTGHLKRSLDYVVGKITNGWRLTFGSNVASTEVPYAKYQEHGTKYIKPVRYLGSSLDDKNKKITNLINRAVNKALKI